MLESLRRKRIWNTHSARTTLATLLIVGVGTMHFPALPLYYFGFQLCWALWQVQKVYVY